MPRILLLSSFCVSYFFFLKVDLRIGLSVGRGTCHAHRTRHQDDSYDSSEPVRVRGWAFFCHLALRVLLGGSPKPQQMKIWQLACAPEAMLASAVFVMKYLARATSGASSENLSCPTPRVEDDGLGRSPQIPGFGTAAGPAQSGRVDVGYRPATPLSAVSGACF